MLLTKKLLQVNNCNNDYTNIYNYFLCADSQLHRHGNGFCLEN